MPNQPAAAPPSAPRRDPYYRPGGTSDYLPAGGQAAPAGSPPSSAPPADRYGAPATGEPYPPATGAAPAYQSPNNSY
jgi:hypothetical protein